MTAGVQTDTSACSADDIPESDAISAEDGFNKCSSRQPWPCLWSRSRWTSADRQINGAANINLLVIGRSESEPDG